MSVFLMILLKTAITGSMYYLVIEKLLKKVFFRERKWEENTDGWIAFFWVIIMIGKCSLFLLRSHSAKKMFEMIRTEEKDERKYKILEKVKEKLNIEKPIEIFIIHGIPSPMIIPRRKKADIYLNEKEYSEKELYWILTHECAHDKKMI